MARWLFNRITGTAAAEQLIGKAGMDEMFGLAGDDKLYGMAGSDRLYAGDGNDTVDGGVGSDSMYGGAGNDLYRVDDYFDLVSETSQGSGIDDGGIDTVQSSITYTLGAFVEKLELIGTGNISGAGNSLANTIKGNAGANVISGGGGNDDLRGNEGNDTLIGGMGKDTLTGGTGTDTFVLGVPDAINSDRIADFVSAEDRIQVFASDYGLSEGHGLIAGKLDASYFALISGASNKQGTLLGHGQFLYNTTNSTLMWDADGSGTGALGVAISTFTAVNGVPVTLTAGDFDVVVGLPTISVSNPVAGSQSEDRQVAFEFTLSAPSNVDVIVDYSTLAGSASSGADFVGVTHGSVVVAAGSVEALVYIDLVDDNTLEGSETFSLTINSATSTAGSLAVAIGSASATIVDEAASVVNIIDTRAMGSTDPSGLTYVPGHGLILSDSEVDEAPFSRVNNLFQMNLDGSNATAYSLFSFTHEPTGLTYDATSGRLYISDDDLYRIFWVDPNNPTVAQGSFATPLAADDPEDIAVNPLNGNIFIVNGLSHSIVEVDSAGNQIGAALILPSPITDPEALAYDPEHDLFYVGGDFSATIWAVDRTGQIVDTIDLLLGYPNAVSGARAHVKDLEFAPTSDPTDDPSAMSLYVADFGNNHPELWGAPSDDGRIIEVHLGDRAPTADWFA